MALDHPADALPPGTPLGRYEILHVLGQGGFGITYVARVRGRSGDKVAIKELFPAGICQRGPGGQVVPAREADSRDLEEVVAMFRREAAIICSLRHENLVHGIEWLEENDTGYLVMAYESGLNLQRHLRSAEGNFKVSPASMAQLCRGILSGLEALHREGICHCDIKPDNIFLGVGFEPILIDLGSACLLAGHGPGVPLTYSRHYSAIEQVDPRAGGVGPWTDIYQFSAVLYRCLAGGKLPDAEDRSRMSQDPFYKLSEMPEVAAAYPAALLQAVDAGLALYPGSRPQSIRQWRDLLDPALRQMPAGEPPRRGVPEPPASAPARADPPPPVPRANPTPGPAADQAPPGEPNPAPSSPPGDPLRCLGLVLLAALVVLCFLVLARGCSG